MIKVKISLNKDIISKDIFVADTFLLRLKGLMFSKEIPFGDGILIKKCNSIHTFFMNYNIDVVFLDHNFKVVKIMRNLSPWRFTSVYFKASQVLELKGGSLIDNLTKGDTLEVLCIN